MRIIVVTSTISAEIESFGETFQNIHYTLVGKIMWYIIIRREECDHEYILCKIGILFEFTMVRDYFFSSKSNIMYVGVSCNGSR